MYKIFGGMFGLPKVFSPELLNNQSDLLFLKNSNLFLTNARSGIFILVDILKPRNVWMPSYLCPSMIHTINLKSTKLRFYEVNHDLQIRSLHWIRNIQEGDLVIFIDYFGFPLSSKISDLVKKQGGYVLEDACQALLSSHVGHYSDFVIFSPRKFVGVPDGGILTSCCNINLENIELRQPPVSWWLKVLEASISRREFDKLGKDRKWYSLFQESESSSPIGYFAMSNLSNLLLFNAFDYDEIAKCRINNYFLLSKNFKSISIYKSLPVGTVPLGFPIRIKDRDLVIKNFYKKNIYPPVHWPLEGFIPKAFYQSFSLSKEIMTMPCDQRYDTDDMFHLISCMIKFIQ